MIIFHRESGDIINLYYGRGGRRISNRLNPGTHALVIRSTDDKTMKLSDPWDGGEAEIVVEVVKKGHHPHFPRFEYPRIESSGFLWEVSGWNSGSYVTQLFGEEGGELSVSEDESAPPRRAPARVPPSRSSRPLKTHIPVPVWRVGFLGEVVEFPRSTFSIAAHRAVWWAHELIGKYQAHLQQVVNKMGPPPPITIPTPRAKAKKVVPTQSRFDLIDQSV